MDITRQNYLYKYLTPVVFRLLVVPLAFYCQQVAAESFIWNQKHSEMPTLDIGEYPSDPVKDTVVQLKNQEEKIYRLFKNYLISIPGGSFLMGDQFGNGNKKERPVHEVRVQGFDLGRYEVTQKQWYAIMGDNPSQVTGCSNCPVDSVSWKDVKKFISKLNKLTGIGYRLPTEAEWEYACRSGGKKQQYCGGGNIHSLGWYLSNSDKSSHPVGEKRPNALGLYDMSGNVWEWVQDCWNDSYYNAPSNGVAWTSGDCSSAILRGGSWYSKPWYVRSTHRDTDKRDDRISIYRGFRLARDR